jgi:hypothetical protein
MRQEMKQFGLRLGVSPLLLNVSEMILHLILPPRLSARLLLTEELQITHLG